MKVCHQCRSERKSLLRWVKCCSSLTLAAVLYIHAVKVRPGCTTFLACCKHPTRESISLLVAFFFPSQVDSCLLMRISLSCGSLASMWIVSTSIRKKVRGLLVSPSGMPRFWQVCWMVAKLSLHVVSP